MYRLTLYVLLSWVFVGLIYSIFGILPFSVELYLFSLLFILVAVYFSNYLFGKLFRVPTNIESSLISALILFLILTPSNNILYLSCTSIFISLSKYLFAINKKHFFNPVAISVLISTYVFNIFPSWWVGNIILLPYVLLGGFLVIKKVRRWDMVLGFMGTVLLTLNPSIWGSVFKDTTLMFFASIMLLEPLTTPPRKSLRIIYGALVGLLFYNQSAEVALLVGNVFSYIVSPKFRLMLTLTKKIKMSSDTYDFIFKLNNPIKFTPGQYMEFTFDHPNPDSRGNRRYLSLANSPTENEIRLGVKVGDPPSSFKRNLLKLTTGKKIAAGQLIGDFILPQDRSKKLVLIAGGIGITPYRSMIKYLIDTGEKRDIILIYTAGDSSQFVYKDVFVEAQRRFGMKALFVDTKSDGHLDSDKLALNIPDFKDRTFYISGSHGVVTAFTDMVKSLKIPAKQIVTDFFPGFA